MANDKPQGASVIPALRYLDAAAAIDWLCKAFGFERKMVVPTEGGKIAHAELTFRNGMVMLGDAKSEFGALVGPPVPPDRVNTQGIYVVVEDADAHYARAKAAGAEIVRELVTQSYGGRDYMCRDPEGHIWSFGTYDPWVAV